MTRRTKRVAELIRHELGTILHSSLNDPRVDIRLLTVTRVEVTPDLRQVRIYVNLLGNDADERTTLRGLNSARKRIRGELGDRIDMRRVPDLTFVIDEAQKQRRRIDNIFAELASERDETDTAAEQPESPLTPLSEDDTGHGRQQ